MPERTLIQVILPLRLEWEPCYWADPSVLPGQRVHATFAHRSYLGVVHKVGVSPDVDESKINAIDSIETGIEPISKEELALWEFIAGYYLCTIGEVYKAACPQMRVQGDESRLSAEKKAAEKLAKKLSELQARENSPRRLNESVTQRLRDEIEQIRREIEQLRNAATGMPDSRRTDIPRIWETKPMLLHAPDPARLTRYKEMIRATLAAGLKVLVLTPDVISCNALASKLGDGFEVLALNSQKTAAQRRRIADAVRSAGPTLIVGTRASIFLPYSDLGLIIVDEEHDSFFKQDEPSPRYNARDCAIKLAQLHNAGIVLGSSSPSMETLYNALSGRYTRADGQDAPTQSAVTVVDLSAEKRKNGVVGIFSRILIQAINETGGTIVLIRGWERQEELQQQIDALFPGRSINCIRYRELRETDISAASLVAVLQADALVNQDDFRADERGAQLAAQLLTRNGNVIIQTNVPARFDGSRSYDELLQERRKFGFPPFTRIVDYRSHADGRTVQRFFLKRDASLNARKKEIAAGVPHGAFIDVDPV